jgi:hypothetical protein
MTYSKCFKIPKWKRADNYVGHDWSKYYVAYSRHRDSDPIDESNFEVILKELGGEAVSVFVAHSSHWAVGWTESILIHQTAYDKLKIAEKLLLQLEDYPLLDEMDYWQRIEQIKGEINWTLK